MPSVGAVSYGLRSLVCERTPPKAPCFSEIAAGCSAVEQSTHDRPRLWPTSWLTASQMRLGSLPSDSENTKTGATCGGA